MKLLSLLALLPVMASAETLKLDRYDQLKLAELLARLPERILEVKSEKDSGIPGLQKKFMSFPKKDAGFKIFCEAHYYNDSPYVSSANCIFEIDPNSNSVEHNYDEYRVKILHEESVSGIFKAIPHGKPRRELRSWERDGGTNFFGKSSEIFRYYFSCLETECEVYVSEKSLLQ